MITWEAIPLKRVARLRVSNVDKKSSEDGVPVRLCNYTDVYYRGAIRSDQDFMEATATPDQVANFRLLPGDVIITKDSETADDIGVPAIVESSAPDLVCGYHLALMRPFSDRIHGRYLYWSMVSQAMRDQLAIAATGVTRFGLRSDSLGSAVVQVPPLAIQNAIADYLDNETTRIDALIKKKKRIVSLLEQRVECLILDRIAKSALVSFGVQEPTVMIKRVLEKLERPARPESEVVTAFRDGQVTARSLRRAEGYTQAWTEQARVQGVEKNDVVVHGLDGFAGAIGVAETDGVCSPIYHVCRPRADGDEFYFGRMLRTLALTDYLGLFATSTRERAVDFRNWDIFGRIPIPNTSSIEQKEIGDLARRIAPLKEAVERSALLANEYRNSLVSAAIAGELVIPGMAA